MMSVAHAHGEDQQGPHGGEIRMPGAFHTEVVYKKPNLFLVYLLDINWDNPITQNSSVKAYVKVANATKAHSTIPLTCVTLTDHFECQSDKLRPALLNGETLTLTAVRDHVIGGPALYKLPLRTSLNKTRH